MVKKEKAIEILKGLREKIRPLIDEHMAWAGTEFAQWHQNTLTAIENIFPTKEGHLGRFKSMIFYDDTLSATRIRKIQRGEDLFVDSKLKFQAAMEKAGAFLDSLTSEVVIYWSEDGNSEKPYGAESTRQAPSAVTATVADPRVVFVVHGRNAPLRDSMFGFLRNIGLHPLEWSEARKATGETNPYVGRILDRAFSMAQAVLVLMTPDDEAWLKEMFRKEDDPPFEKALTGQARPNVLFEAGMAMGHDPDRTVLVEVGRLRPFSDVVGRHTVRLDNSAVARKELAQRLETAGCPVKLDGDDWLRSGSFIIEDDKAVPKAPDIAHIAPVVVSPAAEMPPPVPLTEIEVKILLILSKRDGGSFSVSETCGAHGNVSHQIPTHRGSTRRRRLCLHTAQFGGRTNSL